MVRSEWFRISQKNDFSKKDIKHSYTPVGFVTEYLEVLYDNDIECKVVCDEIGVSD